MNPQLKQDLTQAAQRPLIQYLFLFLITLCVFLPTLWYTFVWDDYGMIALNKPIREWKNIPSFFTESTAFSRQVEGETNLTAWRPLRNVYFVITYKLHHLRPAGWHFQQVLLHSTCTLLLLAFLRRVFHYTLTIPAHQRLPHSIQLATWFAAMMWGVHPAVTEVLGWMKAADDIIACIFGLATLILLLPPDGRPNAKRILIASLIYPLGLLTKESLPPIAAIYPMLLLVLTPHWKQAIHKRSILITAILGLETLVYIIIRHFLVGSTSQGINIAGSFSKLMATMTTAVIKYLQITFWPFWPTIQRASYFQYPIAQSWLEKDVIISSLLILLIVALIGLVGRRHRIILAGALFAALAFLPAANLLPMVQIMAERFMYFPLMGIALLTAALLAQFFRRALYPRLLLPMGLVVAFIVTTELRLPVWTDEEAFQRSIVQHNPQETRALFNLGLQLSRTHNKEPEKVQDALAEFNRAVATTTTGHTVFDAALMRSTQYKAMLAAAKTVTEEGQFDRALLYLDRADKVLPDTIDVTLFRADVLRWADRTTESLNHYKLGEEAGYSSPVFYFHLAEAYFLLDKYEEAQDALDKSLKLDPKMSQALYLQEHLTSKTATAADSE